MKARELAEQLMRFPPDADVRMSVRGAQLDHVHIGVGLDPAKEPCVVVADREAFAGRLPDMVLERGRVSGVGLLEWRRAWWRQ